MEPMEVDSLALLSDVASANGVDLSLIQELQQLPANENGQSRRKKLLLALILILMHMQNRNQQLMSLFLQQRTTLMLLLLLRRRRRYQRQRQRACPSPEEEERTRIWIKALKDLHEEETTNKYRSKTVGAEKPTGGNIRMGTVNGRLGVIVPKFRLRWLQDESLELSGLLGVPRRIFWKLFHLCSSRGSIPSSSDSHRQILAPEAELALFLYWLYSGAPLRHVGKSFGVGYMVADAVVMRQLHHLFLQVDKLVHLPLESQISRIGAGFASLAGSRAFGCVAGALAVTEVEISCRVSSSPRRVQLQLLVDHRGRIMNAFCAASPLSAKRAAASHSTPISSRPPRMVLRGSPLYKRSMFPHCNSGKVILSSKQFPCLSWPLPLLPPYPEDSATVTAEPQTVMFNLHHSFAMGAARHAQQKLAMRWPAVFSRPLGVAPHLAPMVLSICTLIHNMCLQMGCEENMEDEENSRTCETDGLAGIEEEEVSLVMGEKSGEAIRSNLANQLLSKEDGDYEVTSLHEQDHDYALTM